MGFAAAMLLASCGGGSATSSSSSAAASSSKAEETSSSAAASSSQAESSSAKEEVSSKYEQIWNYISPNSADGKYETLPDTKNSGPNYAVQLALEKEGNKAVLTRKIVYMNMGEGKADQSAFLNTVAGGFTVEGTWVPGNDGTYKVNLPEYSVKRGTDEKYPAVELVSDPSDGSIVLKYGFGKTAEGVNQTYETKAMPAIDFAGEYEGSYINEEGETNPIEEVMIEKAEDGTQKGIIHMFARERHSVVYCSILD